MINLELKKGIYIRTNKGKIGKIIKQIDNSGSLHHNNYVWLLDNGDVLALHSNKVKNVGFNLIDLIEVGDYVNGNKVTKLGFDKLLLHCKTIECHQEDLSWGYEGVTFMYTNNDIKDVITKEQFNSMKYVIERDK